MTRILILLLLIGCTERSLNNPYSKKDENKNILYSSFSERPKHLDPAKSYSSNEMVFTGQIYEPPFQYHYLKRPYTLIPLTAIEVPTPTYLDINHQPLPKDAEAQVAFSVYEIKIMPNIKYQPHPALAKDRSGTYFYHEMSQEEQNEVNKLSDFNEMGTRELTADDYIYEIKRLADPTVSSPIYGFMSEYIVGMKKLSETLALDYKKKEKKGMLDLRLYPLSGVTIVDRYTYKITINGKYPQFIYWLAMPFFAPIPWEADRFYSQQGLIDKNITLDWYPIGTGPYMLTLNNPNRQMVMKKNPNFHLELYPSESGTATPIITASAGPGENNEEKDQENELLLRDAGKPLPFIDKVVYSLEKENISVWNKFLQGYYDASGISSDSFDQAIRVGMGGQIDLSDEMKQKKIKLLTGTTPTTYYMGFNMLDAVVGGYSPSARKLRTAISIAIDEEESITIFNNGRGSVMQGPIPPGIFGYQEGAAGINPFVYDWVNEKPKRKSIEEAKAILVAAGYPSGRDVKSGKPLILYFDTTGSGPDSKAQFDWLRKQFSKIDIELVIRNTDYNRFQDKMTKGTAQMFQWGWHADYPDPENFLFLLYGPNAKAGKNGENATNYLNPEFDRLFDQMRNMENGSERQAVIDKMVEIFRFDLPWATGFHPKVFGLYHDWYKNVKPNQMANNTLKYIKINPELRRKARARWNKPIWWPIVVLGIVLIAGSVPAILVYRRKELDAKSPVNTSLTE
ncbi:MAG: ABC transporter substrate-binding protein [Nitrospirota bacterium]